MSTNKVTISPPLKYGENVATAKAMRKAALAIEAAPTQITDFKCESYWVSSEDREETKAYIKYLLDLGFKATSNNTYIVFDFKAERFQISILVATDSLDKEETAEEVKLITRKFINFPELEAALSPTEPKS